MTRTYHDLLAACELALGRIDEDEDGDAKWVADTIRAAIAAARGEKTDPRPCNARHTAALAIASAYQLPHDDHAIEIADNQEFGDGEDGAVWVTARIRVSPEEIDAIA